MSKLRDMMAQWAQPGKVDWIGLRSARRADMQTVKRVQVTDAGLMGDRARAGKRAVTLMQAEHLFAIGGFLGQETVSPEAMRRNIIVSGVNLAALTGRDVAIGTAILRLTVICAPCSRMAEVFGHGGYSAVRGHGGWCAEVVVPGTVNMGDAVRPVDMEGME